MAGTPLAEAFVRVRADTSKFKDDVERGLRGLGPVFGREFGDEFAKIAGHQMAAQSAEFDKVGQVAGRVFGQQMAETGAVRFGTDGAPFVAAGREIGDESGAAAGEAFGERFSQDANGRWHDERGRFVSAARATGEAAGDGFNEGFRRRSSGFGDVVKELGQLGGRALDAMLPSLGRLAGGFGDASRAAAGVLGTAGKWTAVAGGVATLGAAAASAAGFTVQLAAALAPLSGLLAALPGVALTGAAAFTTWKLATGGLGEAMGAALSGNAEALAAAMSKLSERGREFIGEFQQAIPLLQGFKAVAQDNFLEPIIGQLGRWLTSAQALQPALGSLAGEMGNLVRGALDFATSSQTIASFNTIIGNTETLFGGLRAALDPLLRGFTDLGTVGSSWLAGMSGGLTEVLTKFGEWMSAAAESGQALAWMDNALVVVKQLGALIGDAWGILTGVLKAAETAGGSALGVIGNLADKLNEFVNSAQGQQILVDIFRALAEIGTALLPVVTSLAGGLATLAPTVAQIAQLVGPILTTAINALVPALSALGPGIIAVFTNLGTAVQTLANSGALTLIGKALADILVAVTPLLPALAQLLVPALTAIATVATTQLVPALTTVVGWLTQAVNWLTGQGLDEDSWLVRTFQAMYDRAVPIAEQVFAVVGKIFNDLKTWVQDNRTTIEGWGTRLSSIFGSIADIASKVWEAISLAWDTFGAPLLDLVGGVFDGILTVIDGVLTAIGGLFDTVLGVLTGDWERAWGGIKTFFGGIWEAILGVLKVVWAQIKGVISAALAIVGDTWDGAWNKVKTVVTNIWNAITSWISDKVNDVKGFIGRLAEIPGQVADWFGRARQAMIDKLGDAVEWVKGVPGRITGALGSMGSLLYNAGRDVVTGFWNGIVSMWSWLVTEVQNLFGGIADWAKKVLGIASPSKVFAEIGKQLPPGMALGIDHNLPVLEKASQRMAAATAAAFPTTLPAPGFTEAYSPAPAFDGAFAAPALAAVATSSTARPVHVENLNVTVQGVLDPRDPMAARRFAETIRGWIIDLESEGYANA